MHHLKRLVLAAIFAGACSLTVAATPANGLDAAARARLVGEHLLTLQWLSQGDLADAGKLVVKDLGETLSIEGEQLGQGENADDYLRLSGRIVSASRDGFVFDGDIVMRVHHIADEGRIVDACRIDCRDAGVGCSSGGCGGDIGREVCGSSGSFRRAKVS